MNKKNNLTILKIGEKALVKNILLKDKMRRRIGDIGLIPNTIIECLIKAPLGDPSAYLIRGAVIALRMEDAQEILVEYIS